MIDMCFYCQLDTAGQHEWGCPLHPNNLEPKEKPMKVKSKINSLREVRPEEMTLKERIEMLEANLLILQAHVFEHLLGKEAGKIWWDKVERLDERIKKLGCYKNC